MKTYDETMAAIFSKGDAIFAEKNARVRNIKRTSAAVSGVCAAAIVGFTVFRNDDIKNAGNLNNHNDSIITENKQTTSETNTVSSTIMTKKATSTSTTITKTLANSIDDTSTSKASNGNNAIATTSSNNVIPTTTPTTSGANEGKTQITNPLEITDVHTTTTIPAESTTQTTSIGFHEIFNNFVFTFSNEDQSASNESISIDLYYINDTVEKEELSGLFRNESLYKQYFNGEKLIDIETYAELYSIKDYSLDVMLAVKFDDSDKYYRYINKSYHPYSIGDFICDFSVTANDLSNEIYLNEQFLTDFDTKKAWELLTADLSLPNKTTYCQNNDIVPNNSLLLRFESSSKTWLKGSIGVDLRGYIWITINDILTNSFYIGDKKANEIFEYYN